MTTLFISHSSKDNDWATELREALRAEGYESLFLDFHPEDGIHAGAKWEQTLYKRPRRCRGVVALCSADWLASPWCVAEIILAREKGKHVFLFATADVTGDPEASEEQGGGERPRIPAFLKDTQFISLAGLTPKEVHGRLWRGLEEKGLKGGLPPSGASLSRAGPIH
jgi:hypothetical protein